VADVEPRLLLVHFLCDHFASKGTHIRCDPGLSRDGLLQLLLLESEAADGSTNHLPPTRCCRSPILPYLVARLLELSGWRDAISSGARLLQRRGRAASGTLFNAGAPMMPDIRLRWDDERLQSRRAAPFDRQASDWELVLRETHHRMNNTLTLLGASARLDFAKGASGLRSGVDRFERRVVAFGRLYHLLSSSADRQTVSVANFFESLCEAHVEAILEPAGIQCEAVVDEGTLPGAECSRLGLIVAELITNAVKHAFPDGNGGLIRVEVLNRNDLLFCTVADNGIGMISSVQGTGRRIVESLARSIGAQVDCCTGCHGTAVTIAMYSARPG
jgi:two-component sensor histidine kinase